MEVRHNPYKILSPAFEKDISRSTIYKIRNVRLTRDDIDELEQKYRVFVGVYYEFTYPLRY